LSRHYELNVTEENVRELSYKSETIVHGQASGIDNTVATYGKLISYRKDDPPKIEMLNLNQNIPIVIGLSGIESMTAKMVRRVHDSHNNQPDWYDTLLDRMDELSLQARAAIEEGDLAKLGLIMNMNHGYLNTLSVSSREVEELVE